MSLDPVLAFWQRADWTTLLPQSLVWVSVGFALLLVFIGLDYLTGTMRCRPCVVVDKRYTPASTSADWGTVYDASGNLTTVTTFNYHPARYTLIVRVDGAITSYEMDASSWKRAGVGQRLDLKFCYGGLTGHRY